MDQNDFEFLDRLKARIYTVFPPDTREDLFNVLLGILRLAHRDFARYDQFVSMSNVFHVVVNNSEFFDQLRLTFRPENFHL